MLKKDILNEMNLYKRNPMVGELIYSLTELKKDDTIKTIIQFVIDEIQKSITFENITGYTYPSTQSSRHNRMRALVVEDIIKVYFGLFADSTNGKQGFTDMNFNFPNLNKAVFIEVKTTNYYSDNGGILVPFSDFRKMNQLIPKDVYVYVVDFYPRTDTVVNVQYIKLFESEIIDDKIKYTFNPSNVDIVLNHSYQLLSGLKKPNMAPSNQNSLLVQFKNINLCAYGGELINRFSVTI